MCAHFLLFWFAIFNFILSNVLTFSTAILDVVPFTATTNRSFGGIPWLLSFGDYVTPGDCMQISKLAMLLSHSFRGCLVSRPKKRPDPSVDRRIARRYLDGHDVATL
jgi:hypothetical protein